MFINRFGLKYAINPAILPTARPTKPLAFKYDMLFFPNEMEEIRDIMVKIGKKDQVTFKLVDSSSGHDSFLVEVEKFEEHIKDILKD